MSKAIENLDSPNSHFLELNAQNSTKIVLLVLGIFATGMLICLAPTIQNALVNMNITISDAFLKIGLPVFGGTFALGGLFLFFRRHEERQRAGIGEELFDPFSQDNGEIGKTIVDLHKHYKKPVLITASIILALAVITAVGLYVPHQLQPFLHCKMPFWASLLAIGPASAGLVIIPTVIAKKVIPKNNF